MLSNLSNLYKKYDVQISKGASLHVEKTVINRLLDF
jgi:ribonuclease HIII